MKWKRKALCKVYGRVKTKTIKNLLRNCKQILKNSLRKISHWRKKLKSPMKNFVHKEETLLKRWKNIIACKNNQYL
jgi:hypothetical protein